MIVVALPRKKSDPKWKLQFRSYKKADIKKYGKEGHKSPTIEFDLNKSEWEKHGFLTTMTIEEAKERVAQINALVKLDEQQKSKIANDKRLKEQSTIKSAFLPPLISQEFTNKLKEDFYGSEDNFLRSKNMSHWRTCQKIIKEAKVEPSEYEDRKRVFYKIFSEKKYSLSTVEKLVMMINKWGKFSAKKQGKFFEKLPMPKGKDATFIDDSFLDSGKNSKESAPLYPKDLEKIESKLKPEQYRWVFISLWFGLRPAEVEQLKPENEMKLWEIVKQEGHEVLRIYQPKLTRVTRDKRWKSIPVIFDEQKQALEWIESEEIKKPLVKTIKRYLGEKYTLYAGRKGFEALLRRKGIDMVYASRWLGHASLSRTYKDYQDTSKALIPKNI